MYMCICIQDTALLSRSSHGVVALTIKSEITIHVRMSTVCIRICTYMYTYSLPMVYSSGCDRATRTNEG